MAEFDRRELIRSGIVSTALGAAAGSALATPANAQTAAKKTNWTVRSTFARARDAIRQPVEAMAERLSELTDGAFTLKIEYADDGADVAATVRSVGAGELDCAHVDPQRATGVSPILGLAGGAPFGLNARMQKAWLTELRGLDLVNAAIAGQGLVALPGGSLGAKMGGWFRTPITDAAGLKGAKIAIDGLGAEVFKALGAEITRTAPSKLKAALSGGALDGAVWGTPYDDENERLYQAAEVLHYPGWWNGAGQLYFIVSKAKFDALPRAHQLAFEMAAAMADRDIQARYDTQNAAALRRAVASGARLSPYPEGLLDACFAASRTAMDAIAATNPQFKTVLNSMNAMRRDGYLWFQLAENTFDTYMMIQQRKDAL
jgi:TRAP-type mannitol/chloroaromatic compound transport system substrate-binding protein